MSGRRERRGLKKRTKFAICAVAAILLYTVAVLALSFYDKTVPDSLTVAYFAAWTVELGLLFGIEIKDKGGI